MRKVIDIVFGWASTVMFAFAFIIVLYGGDVAGKIEGDNLPVVNNTEITKIEKDGNYTLIWGESYKLRECSFENIKWRFGDSEYSINVSLDILEPSKIREGGRFTFGPWRVHLTEEQLINSSFAIAYHDCHVGYQTQTIFYP